MTGAGIVVSALGLRYGAVEALSGVDLEVAPGELLGLLGPNGAGKTSLIEAVAGLRRADTGTICIDGHDVATEPDAARRATGVVLQQTGLPAGMTPREAIATFAMLHDAREDEPALIERFGLRERADAAIDTLSGGQRQRLALALAFIGRPRAILLDEPGAGLDPAMRRIVQDDVLGLRDRGCAVLMATHDMAEAERLCDRIAVLDRGRIVATGAPAALAGAGARRIWAQFDRAPDGGWPDAIPGIGAIAGDGAALSCEAPDLNRALTALTGWADGAGLVLTAVRGGPPTLEAFILALGRAG